MFRFFDCAVFFYWNEIENANLTMCRLGNPIPNKIVFVSATQVKTVGEDAFSVAKVQFFRGGKHNIINCV